MRLQITTALIALAAGSPGAAQTGEAIVAKFSSASMPSTVTITASGASGLPGKMVTIPLAMAVAGMIAPTSLRLDLGYDATKLTFVAASGVGLTTTVMSTSVVRLTTSNLNGVASGVVASVTFTMTPTFSVDFTTLTTMNCVSANLSTALSTGCTGAPVSRATCTVSGSAAAGVVDVQTMMNQVLGASPATNDLNGDGVVNVADIQLVVAAAMGLGCLI